MAQCGYKRTKEIYKSREGLVMEGTANVSVTRNALYLLLAMGPYALANLT